MAKKEQATAAATSNGSNQTPKAPSSKPSASEIDDIFASAGAKSASVPVSSVQEDNGKPSVNEKDGVKRKRRKVNSGAADAKQNMTSDPAAAKQPASVSQAPVTITDTSAKALKPVPDASQSKKKRKRVGNEDEAAKAAAKEEEDEIFKDSRGTSNRRLTDDGLPIYDIKELNIGLGGDTPLCPFDCDCCF